MSDISSVTVEAIQGRAISTTAPSDKESLQWNATTSEWESHLIGFTWQGSWSGATAYALNDAVNYNGSSYLAVQAGTNQQPDTSPLYWEVLAEKGATGSTGATGAAGATGATGPQGANFNPVDVSTFIFTDDFNYASVTSTAIGPRWSVSPNGVATISSSSGYPGVIQLQGGKISTNIGTSWLPHSFVANIKTGTLISGQVITITVGPYAIYYDRTLDSTNWRVSVGGTDQGQLGALAANTWYKLTATYNGSTFSLSSNGGTPFTPGTTPSSNINVLEVGVTSSGSAQVFLDYLGLQVTGLSR